MLLYLWLIPWLPFVQAAPVLRITTAVNEPFLMYKNKAETLKGNDKFEGYLVDLVQRIAKIANFSYILTPVKDGAYGTFNKENRTWNGMVGELIRGEADMAAADITKTYGRAEVIDFSTAFMHSGITILFKKETGQKVNFFQFLTPFSNSVWLFMVMGIIGITFLLWGLSRLSPAEKGEEQLTLVKSLWTVSATFLQQGVDWIPRSVSTRFLLVIWWLFALVIIASYTANLAAFLAVQRAQRQFKSVEELVAQTEIPYGTLKFSSMMSFFEESQIETYERAWEYMKTHPSVLVPSKEAALKRVQEGSFAYMGDSAWAEFQVAQYCKLMTVGGLINSEGYGFGFPKGSPWEEKITKAILFLTDNSVLVEIKEKWWSRKSTKACDSTMDETLDSMGLQASIGVFVMLLTGIVIAVVAGLIEWWVDRDRKLHAVEAQISGEGQKPSFDKFEGTRPATTDSRWCSKLESI